MASGSFLPPDSAQPNKCESDPTGPPAQTKPGRGAGPENHADPLECRDLTSSDRILFLDDDPARARTFLGCHPEAVWVQTAGECIARLSESWDQVHLDHDLGGEIFVDSSREDCGMEVVRWLCSQPHEPLPCTWFFVHSHNAEAADLMVQSLRHHGYQAVYRPFGIDLLAWFSVQPSEEPDQPPPQPPPPQEPALLAPALRGWLDRRLKRFRRSAPPRLNADHVDLPGIEPSRGNSNFGAE